MADGPLGITDQAKKVAGDPVPLSHTALNIASGAVGSFKPFSRICQHVCGFHFYAHDMKRGVEAHHYCSHQSEEVRQCVIYDSGAADARLIGIEYIISSKLFEGLPAEEKKLWHSHKFEVSSGMLYAPEIPTPVEDLEMQKLTDTYGKTFHTWQVDRGDTIPLGPPQLMMAFTGDGQIDPKLVEERDKREGKNTAELAEHRKKLTYPDTTNPEADSWVEKGIAWQTEMKQTSLRK